MADDSTALEQELTQAKAPFIGDFQEKRKSWDDLTHGAMPITLPAEVSGSQEGLDYETPDIEKTIFDNVDVLMMNPTTFDAQPLAQTNDAREKARDIMLWTSRVWQEMDYKRWWDAFVGEGQVRHGVATFQLCWREYTEPETTSEDPEDALEERNKAYRDRPNPFYLHQCDLYGSYWVGDDPVNGSDAFYYEYEIPFVEAKRTFMRPDKSRLTIDSAGKIGWLADSEAVDSDVDGARMRQRVRVLVRDARDITGRECPLPGCEHAMRTITIYVRGEAEKLDVDAHKVDEYDSPFKDCSFFVVSGRKMNDSDMHRRYRPMVAPLYVQAGWSNYLNTLLATEIRQDYSEENLYIDGSTTPEWVQLPEGGAVKEFPKPEAGSGAMPFYPATVKSYPKQISQHLMEMVKDSQAKMAEYSSNRFLTGNANTEASNATGAAFLQQTQAASLPFARLLAESDAAIVRTFRNIYHAIRYWGLSDVDGAPARYYAITTGQESLARGSSRPGEAIYLDAKKLAMNFDLTVRTKSSTLAEEQAKFLLAQSQYRDGLLTPEQYMRAAGTDDVQTQFEQLRAAETRKLFQPLTDRMKLMVQIRRMSALTGYDFTSMAQQLGLLPPPQPSPQPSAGGPGAAQAPGETPPPNPTGTTPGVPQNNMLGRAMPLNGLGSGPSPTGGYAS